MLSADSPETNWRSGLCGLIGSPRRFGRHKVGQVLALRCLIMQNEWKRDRLKPHMSHISTSDCLDRYLGDYLDYRCIRRFGLYVLYYSFRCTFLFIWLWLERVRIWLLVTAGCGADGMQVESVLLESRFESIICRAEYLRNHRAIDRSQMWPHIRFK